MDLPLALLLNFGASLMKNGIYRVVNDYRPTQLSTLRVHRGMAPGKSP